MAEGSRQEEEEEVEVEVEAVVEPAFKCLVPVLVEQVSLA